MRGVLAEWCDSPPDALLAPLVILSPSLAIGGWLRYPEYGMTVWQPHRQGETRPRYPGSMATNCSERGSGLSFEGWHSAGVLCGGWTNADPKAIRAFFIRKMFSC